MPNIQSPPYTNSTCDVPPLPRPEPGESRVCCSWWTSKRAGAIRVIHNWESSLWWVDIGHTLVTCLLFWPVIFCFQSRRNCLLLVFLLWAFFGSQFFHYSRIFFIVFTFGFFFSIVRAVFLRMFLSSSNFHSTAGFTVTISATLFFPACLFLSPPPPRGHILYLVLMFQALTPWDLSTFSLLFSFPRFDLFRNSRTRSSEPKKSRVRGAYTKEKCSILIHPSIAHRIYIGESCSVFKRISLW